MLCLNSIYKRSRPVSSVRLDPLNPRYLKLAHPAVQCGGEPKSLFQTLLSSPWKNNVVLSPHVYPSSVTKGTLANSVGVGLWSRLSSYFSAYTTQVGFRVMFRNCHKMDINSRMPSAFPFCQQTSQWFQTRSHAREVLCSIQGVKSLRRIVPKAPGTLMRRCEA